jgi:hypothetical protein
MNKRNSMKFLVPVVLFASVVAVAEEWHPSGFQPAPVFEDEGLAGRAARPRPPSPEPAKPAVSAAKDSLSQPAAGLPRPAPAPAVAAVQPAEGWTDILAANYPVGLIVLVLAGYVFRNVRRIGGKVRNDSSVPSIRSANSGKTGVARYLEGLGMPIPAASSETGVAKYLRKLGE